jgi:hypothetical protein
MASECGNLSALAAKPDEDLIIATVALHGIWGSRDGGDSWTELGTGSGSAEVTNRGVTFLFDPDDPNVFWEAGIYNGTGIFRTDDGGTSFQGLGDSHHNDTVSVDFEDPERRTVLAGGHEQTNTVYRSTNRGQTWTNVGTTLPLGTNHSTAVHVIDAQNHLVGCSGWAGGTSGVFRTANGGQGWEQVSESGGASTPLAHTDGSLYWASPDGGIVRGSDDGQTWSERLGAGEIGSVRPIELPDRRIASVGPSGVALSNDRGASWYVVTTPLPFQTYGLVYSTFQRAFYVFHFSCNPETAVPEDAVMSYGFDYETE